MGELLLADGRHCPVCGRWILNAGWRSHARMHVRHGELIECHRSGPWGETISYEMPEKPDESKEQ